MRKALSLLGCGLGIVGALFAWQRPFREFPGIEYRVGEIPIPPDYNDKTEWVFARLMFPPGPLNGYAGRDRDWHTGISLWSQDFPRADRHFSLAVRRLTRIHVARGGAARQPGRGRRVRFSVAVCGPGGRVGIDRRAGAGAARVLSARRLLHGGRFARPGRMVRIRIAHEEGVSRTGRSARSRTTIRSSTWSTI